MTRIVFLVLLALCCGGCVHSTVTVRYQPDPVTSIDVTLYR